MFTDPRENPKASKAHEKGALSHDPHSLVELHRLCRAGRLYDVEEWIKAGAPLQLDRSGVLPKGHITSALEIALGAGNHSLVLLLLANGYDPNLEPRSPLNDAIRGRRWDLLDLLLDWGADPRRVDLSDLFDSYRSELWDRFQSLGVNLTEGYDLAGALGYHTSNKPLFGWAKRHREADPAVQRALNVALGQHTREGNEKGVLLSLWAGADPHAPAPDLRYPDLVDEDDVDPADRYLGNTAIHEACVRGDLALLRRLGPDPAVDDFDALYQVAANGSVIEFLASFALPLNVGEVISRQVYWMEVPPIGYPRSCDTLQSLFGVGARWQTATPDQVASVRRSLLRMSDSTFIDVMKLLAATDHCSPDILKALGRTNSIRARVRKVGFLPSPNDKRGLNWYPPTRAREVVKKFDLEPKGRHAKEQPRLPRTVEIGRTRVGTQRRLLDRSALFQLVWSEPVEKLAKRWGMSDRGLAKACARLKVPVPPRGYWAKRQHGYSPRRPALPALRPGEAEEIVVFEPPPEQDL